MKLSANSMMPAFAWHIVRAFAFKLCVFGTVSNLEIEQHAFEAGQ